MNPQTPRALALSLLLRCESDTLYSNLILDTAIRRNKLSDADRGLLTALVYGTLEKRITLDYLIDALSDRPADQLDAEVRLCLHLGLYQLRFMDRIPAHAALNETVSLAPKRARGFVNALLRRYTREGEHIAFPDKDTEPLRYLSVTYSFPDLSTIRIFTSLIPWSFTWYSTFPSTTQVGIFTMVVSFLSDADKYVPRQNRINMNRIFRTLSAIKK